MNKEESPQDNDEDKTKEESSVLLSVQAGKDLFWHFQFSFWIFMLLVLPVFSEACVFVCLGCHNKNTIDWVAQTTSLYVSQFWRLEVQDQVISKLMSGEKALFFFKFIYLFILKDRGREKIPSRFPASSTERNLGLNLVNGKIMTRAKSRHLTNWATQVSLMRIVLPLIFPMSSCSGRGNRTLRSLL